MKNAKAFLFLLSVLWLLSSCSKDDRISSSVLSTIESPYILEALREQNVGTKMDVESLTELKLTFDVGKMGEENCEWRYNYNLHEKNLLSGLDEFKSLKKLILVIRQELNDDSTNFVEITSSTHCYSEEDILNDLIVKVENLTSLEEFYFSSHLRNVASTIALEVQNCPSLKKIGTANPFVGIKNYPSDDIIVMDEANFEEENPTYEKFYSFAGSDDSGEASNISSLMHNTEITLVDLPMFKSLHLFQSSIKKITKTNCPNWKNIFFFKKRGSLEFEEWLFDDALNDIRELYIDYQYFAFFDPCNPVVFDLSSFSELSTFYYKFNVPGCDRNSVPVGSKLRIQNGQNLANDLKVSFDFRNYFSGTFKPGDSRRIALCLDEGVSEEFLINNIFIKSEHGNEGYEAITLSCD